MDVNVRDYGAVGNDVHDDTLAFRNALRAIRATGGNCFVPSGTYKISEYGIESRDPHTNKQVACIRDGMNLVGTDKRQDGSPAAYLRVHNNLTNGVMSCSGYNWSIRNIGIDLMNFYGNTSFAGLACINVLSGTNGNWTIDGCWLINTGINAMVVRGTNFTISNNNIICNFTFGTGAHPLHTGVTITSSTNIQNPSHGLITNNTSKGVGWNCLGDNLSFIGNTVKQPGSGAGFFMRSEPNSHSNIYSGNNVFFGQEGIDDAQNGHWAQVLGYEIWSDDTLLVHNSSHDNCGGGISVGGHNCVVAFNHALDNGRNVGNPNHQGRDGITAREESANNASSSLFLGNTAYDSRPAAQKTQEYGLSVQSDRGDKIRCLAIIGNVLHGNKLGDGTYAHCQPNVVPSRGRDIFNNLCSPKQKDLIRSLFDTSQYTLGPQEYDILNGLLR